LHATASRQAAAMNNIFFMSFLFLHIYVRLRPFR